MADIYEQAEDWKNFALHFKNYHALKEEIHNEETAKKISNLGSQRKLSEIEKERELERREYNATFKILNRILPGQIVGRVKVGEENIADKFPSASVLFADIVGFTPLAEKLGADDVLKLLSSIFSHFDSLCEKFGVEKIKTVGDSYMAASGVPVESEYHLLKIAQLALAMQEDIKLNLDFKIPEPNRISVILQTDETFFCNSFSPAGERFEFAVGNHCIPFGSPVCVFHNFSSVH